ncbi:serine hydroxymethyltransferase [Candidatus Bathyarchaeota archaeon]|nr:serine hydroxymethyltransferase [Candidatus Bathyarchaeota archaeon]
MNETSEPDWYAKSITWKSEEEKEYYRKLREQINWNNPKEVYTQVKKAYNNHDTYREQNSLNLIASENIMSPLAQNYLGSNLGFRVCDGPVGKKVFGSGVQYLEEIEAICVEASRKLFDARYVEHRLLSGTMGCAAIHFAFSDRNSTIMTQSSDAGGVVCNRPEGPPKYTGAKVIDIPWDTETMNVDLEEFKKLYDETKPELIILGAMITLFPYPVKEISEIAQNSIIAYDGAHVGGLIAGKRFQDPLKDGADLLLVNTHKQMGGPPGSLILSNEEKIAHAISETTFPFLVATPYCNKFASLAVTLAELLEHSKDYADQIVKNAKTLGSELDKNGINVLCKNQNYTESHQLMLDIRDIGSGYEVEQRLAESHIICNKMPLPGDPWDERSGIRIGTNEVTRRGMKEKEMKIIAEIITEVLMERTQVEKAAETVSDFMTDFQDVHYTLE